MPVSVPRTAAARRRTREVAVVREEILDAAARAFCRAGYSAATMQAIAREAGFAASALYTYFESKEDIHDALIASVRQELRDSLQVTLPRGLTFAQRMESLLLRQLEQVERRREAYQLFYALAPAASHTARGGPPQLVVYADLLAAWMAEGLPKAQRVHAPDLAWLFVGIAWSFKRRWLLTATGPEAIPLTAQVERILALFLKGAEGVGVHA